MSSAPQQPKVFVFTNSGRGQAVEIVLHGLASNGIDVEMLANDTPLPLLEKGAIVVLLLFGNADDSPTNFNQSILLNYKDVLGNNQYRYIPIVEPNTELQQLFQNLNPILWTENVEQSTNEIVQRVFAIYHQEQQEGDEKDHNKKVETPEEAQQGIAYWLIKMGGKWEKDIKEANQPVVFHPTDYKGNSIPFTNGISIKSGDLALAYVDGASQHVFCIMKVEGVSDIGPKEKPFITLKVEKLFTYPISYQKIKDRFPLNPKDFGPSSPFEKVISISEEIYHYILSREIKPFVNNYLPNYLTEGNHAETKDQLEFGADIDSFANIICLKAVKPPLAIGLFGNWGSGKSFFMEKLETRIIELVNLKSDSYVRNVVPVRFNSWHYSDANLWASMVTQIFQSLNNYKPKTEGEVDKTTGEIYLQLSISKDLIASAEKLVKDKEKEISKLENDKMILTEKIKQEQDELHDLKPKTIFTLVWNSPEVQESIGDLKKEFGGKELDRDLEKLKSDFDKASQEVNHIRRAWDYINNHTRGRWFYFWLSLVIIVTIAVVGWLFYSVQIKSVIVKLSSVTGVIIAAITSVKALFHKNVKSGIDYFQKLKNVIETVEKNQKVAGQGINIDLKTSINNNLVELHEQHDLIKTQLNAANKRKGDLEQRLMDIRQGKVLGSFLTERNSDEEYLNQLGIISRIRKDFQELSDHFEQQKEAFKKEPETEKEKKDRENTLQIDRIVLYIDDLDRCNEDIVVKVLEAIHLLLAFPLFVVVVGVDPRWLNNALTEKYKLLFGAGKKEVGEAHSAQQIPEESSNGIATSYDYLEKIFQIPFALKPINKTGRTDLLAYLTHNEMEKIEVVGEDEQAEIEDEKKRIAPKPVDDLIIVKQEPIIEPTSEIFPSDAGITLPTKKSLEISKQELAYMQSISELFGNSPRTINRYVNIYRIIKAHGGLKVFDKFESDEFVPILFLLAVVVGQPSHAEALFKRLKKADPNQKCSDFLEECGFSKWLDTDLDIPNRLSTMSVKFLQYNQELVSRFSFRMLMKEMG